MIIQKIVSYKMKGMALEEIASIAGWTHSMNASTAGHESFKLLTKCY